MLLTAVLVGLAGCTDDGPVAVEAPEPGVAAEGCTELVEALPETVADLPRRPIDPEDAAAAAWGTDEPVVLRCGVPSPAGFDALSTCQEVDGVAWFAPEEQVADQGLDAVLTTVGFQPHVELRVPASLRPPAAALTDVSAVVAEVLPSEPC